MRAILNSDILMMARSVLGGLRWRWADRNPRSSLWANSQSIYANLATIIDLATDAAVRKPGKRRNAVRSNVYVKEGASLVSKGERPSIMAGRSASHGSWTSCAAEGRMNESSIRSWRCLYHHCPQNKTPPKILKNKHNEIRVEPHTN